MLSKIEDSDLLRTSYSIFEIWTADILSGRMLPTCECGSIDLAVPVLDWSCDPVGDPAPPFVRTALRHGRFYAFFHRLTIFC